MPAPPEDLRTAIERGYASRRGKDRKLFYELLRGAPLWIAVDEEIEALGQSQELKLADLRLATIPAPMKRKYLLVFTSESRGHEFRAGAHPLLEVQGEQLVAQFQRLDLAGVRLDEDGKPSATITRVELVALATGRDPQAPAESIVGGDFVYGDIARSEAEIPDGWSRELLALLTPMRATAAYIIDMRIGAALEPRLVVLFDPWDEEADPAREIAELRARLGSVFEIMTTEDEEVRAACAVFGRRLY